MIDAGFSAKRVTEALRNIDVSASDINAILVTHEHSDHIAGIGVLSRKHGIPVYANRPTWAAMYDRMNGFETRNMRIIQPDEDFSVGSIRVYPFPIPHDAAAPMGYCCFSGGGKVGVMTDLGHVPDYVIRALQDCDIVLVEANHDADMLKNGSYPPQLIGRIASKNGHLSNKQCAEAMISLYEHGVKRFVLGHMSENNNREELAVQTVRDAITEYGIDMDEVSLYLAYRDRAGQMFAIH